jgi:serine/threonine protein phosphatase PrpC
MYFCGVFDGHGPDGHKIARYVRDNLPSKLSQVVKIYQLNTGIFTDANVASSFFNHENNRDPKDKGSQDLSLSSWEASFVKSFKDMDEELSLDSTIDSFCSGSTAVTLVKQVQHNFATQTCITRKPIETKRISCFKLMLFEFSG